MKSPFDGWTAQQKLTWWRQFQKEAKTGKPGKATKMFDSQMRYVKKKGGANAVMTSFEDTIHRKLRESSGDYKDPEYQKYMRKNLRERGLAV